MDEQPKGSDEEQLLLRINVDDLINECALQADNFYNAGFAYAMALGEVRREKAGLDLHKSQMSNQVRQDPHSFGVDKVTEASIAEVVTIDVTTQELINALADAEEELARATVFKDAWMQRSSLLKAEVDMHLGSFSRTTNVLSAKSKESDLAMREIAGKGNKNGK